ncbi:UNVERIFIED_CONTAM: putative ribonuclease H protein [Sesamum radiatum]|uniref:Ribonuclease H protein n=1 Tax=Sesamum radiatum TaxID=300843 RepID=A0AAW2L7K2_SESRA
MTIWLGHVLPKVISLSQSGFVPGRLLSDNVLLAQELVHSLESRRPDANVVFKLDMAKAYDWGFFTRPVGYDKGILSLRLCLYSLLIIYREAWSGSLQRHPTMFYQAPGLIRVSHLAYADDLMIFTTTCRQNMELLCDFLRAYERVSGQLINDSKSSFIVGRQASSLHTQAVQDVLGYQLKHLPVTYLGVPLYKGNRKACLFDPIISRLRDLLQGWAMTNLSHGGRLALIRSVLQATPLHLLQVIHLPKSVLITIERIFNGFFWAHIMGVSTFIGLLRQRHIFRWRKTICQIPIAAGQGDKIVWTGSSTGDFSTKSAWEAIRQPSPRWQLLADVWHRSLRPTISVFLWRLFQDRILVDARMRQKGFIFPSKCQCCEAEETVSHLFIESAAVQGVWQHFAAIFGLCLCDTGSLTHMVHFWRYSTPFHSDLHIRTLILFLILWFTWTQRNAAKYRGVLFSTDGIILKQIPRAPSIVRWHAPSPSWFKLNTDGSSLGNPGLAGAAGIIRDSAGHVHLAYQFALGIGTSVLAELTAVWRGMELALTHGLALLVVEVDATTVISLLKSRASGKWEVQHLIMRIVCLQQLLVADVQHVFREVNGVADHLAKEAASL